MRRLLSIGVAATAVMAASAPLAGGAPPAGSLTPAEEARFPERAWVVSLPDGQRVNPAAVRVRENGRAVRDLEVVGGSGAEGGTAFGTMLVIDTSRSMQGRPIADAMAAARSFAAERPAGQALGVVLFNRRPTVLLRPTRDQSAIDSALAATPTLHPGTNIHDAAAAALGELQRSKVGTGSVVLLSDGADTGSRVSGDQVVGMARRDHTRIFGVGLTSRSFDSSSLRRLADSTGGRYSAASSQSLGRLFSDLGRQLAGEVLIRYVSTEPAQRQVLVSVDAGRGAAATATYTAPRVATVLAPSRTPANASMWTSGGVLAATSALCALLVGVAVLVVRRGMLVQRTRARVSAFVGGLGEAEEATALGGMSERLQRGAMGRLSGRAWWTRFETDVDIAGIDRRPIELALAALMASVSLSAVFLAAGATPLVVLAVAAPIAARVEIRRRADAQRRQFAEQLPDTLQVFSSALRAGHSFIGAIGVVVDDAPEPTKREFRRVLSDEKLGIPIEDALNRVVGRMESRELAQVGVVASLQQETGGNMAEVLDRVVESVRERADLRRLVRTLTAQGRAARVVMTGLPVALALLIAAINPGYLDPLFTQTAGRIALAITFAMVVAGSFAIKRIVEIKV